MAQKNFKVNNGITTPQTQFIYEDGNAANTRTVNVSTSTASANYSIQLPPTSGSLTPAVLGAVTLNSGIIDTIAITSGGSGYTAAPAVIITGDGEFGVAHAVLTNGVVTSIVVDSPGQGYTTATASLASPGARYLTLDNNSGNLSWQQITTIDLQSVNSAVLYGNNGVISGDLGFTYNPGTFLASIGCTAPGGQSSKFGYSNVTHQVDGNTFTKIAGDTGITFGGAEDYLGTNPHAINIQTPQPTTGAWANYTLTLPYTVPSDNTFIKSNANGFLSFATVTSLVNGNSNVVVNANSDVTISTLGVANQLVVSEIYVSVANMANFDADSGVIKAIGSYNMELQNPDGSALIRIPANAAATPFVIQANAQNMNVAANSNIFINSNTSTQLRVDGNLTLSLSNTSANITGIANVSGNILTGGRLLGTNSYDKPRFIQPNSSDANWTYGIYTDGASNFWMQAQFFGQNQATRGFRVLESEGNSVVFSVNGSGNTVMNGNATITGTTTANGDINVNYSTGSQRTVQLTDGVANSFIVGVGNGAGTWGGAGSLNFITSSSPGAPIVFFPAQGEALRITTTGANVTGNLNVSANINATRIQNGNSNVTIVANGNVVLNSVGNGTMVITGTGANITGTGNFSGNLSAANFIGYFANGNSNIAINSNGNIGMSVGGFSNLITVTSTGANIAGTANITGNLTAANASLGNLITANFANITNTVTTGIFVSTNSVGDEGGELRLAIPASNSNLTSSVTVDVYQNKLRLFETGGNTRGAFIDLANAADGVGSSLLFASTVTANSVNTVGNVINVVINGTTYQLLAR